MKKCIQCLVSGRVQGVFFRASACAEATRLGITGHAINLPGGCVEVLACGEPAALEAMQVWLEQGPPGARVERVDCAPVSVGIPETFTAG